MKYSDIEKIMSQGAMAKLLREMDVHKRTIEEVAGGGVIAKHLREMNAHKRTIEEVAGGGAVAKLLRDMNAQSITSRAIERLAKASGSYEIEAIDDTVISIDGETVDLAEIDQKIGEILKESTAEGDFFDDIFLWLDSLPKTLKYIATHYIFTNLIIPFFLLYISINHPSILCFSPECKKEEPRAFIKQVITETNDEFSLKDLNSYRVVTAPSGLNVRSTGNSKGEKIGGIQLGVRVMLLLKIKDWSLVEYYEPENDEYLQGWVYSRYLKKFN